MTADRLPIAARASWTDWFERGRATRRRTGPLPRRLHAPAATDPFDISVADAELLDGGASPPTRPATGHEVVARAGAPAGSRCAPSSPAGRRPTRSRTWARSASTASSDALADEPCPLLDDAGRCRHLRSDRPLVCRLIGLGMITPAGRADRERLPDPGRVPRLRRRCRRRRSSSRRSRRGRSSACGGGRSRRFGDAERWGFETTIAAAVVEARADGEREGT